MTYIVSLFVWTLCIILSITIWNGWDHSYSFCYEGPIQTEPLEILTSKYSVLQCVRCSNVWYSCPHCVHFGKQKFINDTLFFFRCRLSCNLRQFGRKGRQGKNHLRCLFGNNQIKHSTLVTYMFLLSLSILIEHFKSL